MNSSRMKPKSLLALYQSPVKGIKTRASVLECGTPVPLWIPRHYNTLDWRLLLFTAPLIFLSLALATTSPAQPQSQQQPRTRVLFNDGWLFQKGDPAGADDTLRHDNIRDLIIHTGDNLLNYNPSRPPAPPAPDAPAASAPARDAKGESQAKAKGKSKAAPAAILPARVIPTPAGIASIAYLRPDYDDSGWRKLTLPHDWGIEGPFSLDLPAPTGKLPWGGVGWYRKHFNLPPAPPAPPSPAGAAADGRRTYLEIDGAQSHALVFLNGRLVGGWPFGYTSWRVDLTPHLKTGAGAENENVLAIRLDNPAESSRWYPGSGIYRNVWLVQTAPVAIAQWGVFVTTPSITKERALVNIAVTLDNNTAKPADAVEVTARLFAADEHGRPVGAPVATGAVRAFSPGSRENTKISVPAGNQANCSATLAVPAPRLWSLAQRNRYVAETTVTQNGAVLDRVLTPFGIRTIETTADRGFLLNGERVEIRGVCQHHDLGALGAAINTRALERQIEILQSFGCNAIRTSHNPPAPELLELCDRMGMLVMDESFDCWAAGKKADDYGRLFADWHEKDLRALVRRDRNHPCVIQWSIGNEILELWQPDGWKLAAHLAAIVREEDRTRPVVAGLNNIQSGYNGTQNVVDIVGYNYKPQEYAPFRRAHPHIPLMGAETASTVSSRGEYFFPVSEDKLEGRADHQVSSYDLYAPPWAMPPDTEWRGLDETPQVIGEFVWTGFDYLGEPTPYNSDPTNILNYSDPAVRARAEAELAALGRIRTPSRSSYFGIVDLAGFPKDRYYLYQSRWRPDHPMAHILPHWNWPERIGQVTPVFVYTSGDEAELFLNGKSLGRKKRGAGEYRFRWNDVVYAPGELRVKTWKNRKPWAETVKRTTGAPAKILLTPDRTVLRASGVSEARASVMECGTPVPLSIADDLTSAPDPKRHKSAALQGGCAAPDSDADLSFITVTIADKDGQQVPRAKNHIKFTITGPAEILATDNGDATSFESFQSNERHAYNGLALVIVRPKCGEKGVIKLTAQSEGLAPAEITLSSE